MSQPNSIIDSFSAIMEAIGKGCTVKLGEDTWVDQEGIWWDSNYPVPFMKVSPTLLQVENIGEYVAEELNQGTAWEIL